MNNKIDDATTPEEMRREITRMRQQRKSCATIGDAQKFAILEAMEQCCHALGLSSMATSPVDLVREVTDICKEVDRLRRYYIFYKRRCEALQRWQSTMRDPERTVVCDILANGFTLDQATAGDRYGGMKPSES